METSEQITAQRSNIFIILELFSTFIFILINLSFQQLLSDIIIHAFPKCFVNQLHGDFAVRCQSSS